MPLELVILLAGGAMVGFFFLAVLVGAGVFVYRRKAEQRYGEPPRWMVTAWKQKAAAKARRREADARLVDLVQEHEAPGDPV